MRVSAFGFSFEAEAGLFAAPASRRKKRRLGWILTRWREFTDGAARRVGRMVLEEAGRGSEELTAGDAAFLIAFFGTARGHRSRAEGAYFGR